MAEATTSAGFSTDFKMVPWWLVLLEGIAAILIGMAFLFYPVRTLFFIVQVVGIYWLIVGIINIVSIFLDKSNWGWKLFSGIIGIIAGAIILVYPVMTTLIVPATLTLLIGFMGLIIGCVGLLQGFRGGGWGAGILGILSIILGLLIIGNVMVSTAFLLYLLALFAIVGGIAAIYMAYKIHKQ
ncbi:MAG: DUF308 domain-containing protein [Methanotrichaceae archaeon]|nr:DUF308 domain-containing protein [Methanotrichaceae archaeon]